MGLGFFVAARTMRFCTALQSFTIAALSIASRRPTQLRPLRSSDDMPKPIIGVMGGSKATRKVAEMAEELGRLIAERGWTLLNGGRNVGVMAASARGAHQAGGTVIGILPDRKKSKASPDLDYVIATGMRDARNMINVLSSDVVIACKGSLGTLTESAPYFALRTGKDLEEAGDRSIDSARFNARVASSRTRWLAADLAT